jgi:excisionase family DNA binding protein
MLYPRLVAAKSPRRLPKHDGLRRSKPKRPQPKSSKENYSTVLVKAVAEEVARILKPEVAKLAIPTIQPELLDVKQAAIYLGRTEPSIKNMIWKQELPVVRAGRRVHLHRRDLDAFIEKNKY